MKTKNLFLLVILLLPSGCSNSSDLFKDDNAANPETPQVYPVEIQTSDFSLPEGCRWKCHTEQSNVYVIRSIEDILPFIDGEFLESVIDFGKYSLLYARGQCISGIDDITKQLQQISENEYLLNIDITNNLAAVAPLWNIAVLVPVIPQNAIVKLNVVLSNSGDEFKDTGYIVDSYSCTDGFKGYYIISENLKDTLISYNLPDVYKDPLVFYDMERPEYSYRYEYKIEFVYTIAGEEDIPICVALYHIRYPYARQIIIKSANKL